MGFPRWICALGVLAIPAAAQPSAAPVTPHKLLADESGGDARAVLSDAAALLKAHPDAGYVPAVLLAEYRAHQVLGETGEAGTVERTILARFPDSVAGAYLLRTVSGDAAFETLFQRTIDDAVRNGRVESFGKLAKLAALAREQFPPLARNDSFLLDAATLELAMGGSAAKELAAYAMLGSAVSEPQAAKVLGDGSKSLVERGTLLAPTDADLAGVLLWAGGSKTRADDAAALALGRVLLEKGAFQAAERLCRQSGSPSAKRAYIAAWAMLHTGDLQGARKILAAAPAGGPWKAACRKVLQALPKSLPDAVKYASDFVRPAAEKLLAGDEAWDFHFKGEDANSNRCAAELRASASARRIALAIWREGKLWLLGSAGRKGIRLYSADDSFIYTTPTRLLEGPPIVRAVLAPSWGDGQLTLNPGGDWTRIFHLDLPRRPGGLAKALEHAVGPGSILARVESTKGGTSARFLVPSFDESGLQVVTLGIAADGRRIRFSWGPRGKSDGYQVSIRHGSGADLFQEPLPWPKVAVKALTKADWGRLVAKVAMLYADSH